MHEDELVKSIQKFIEENYNKEKITIEQLSRNGQPITENLPPEIQKANITYNRHLYPKNQTRSRQKLLESNRLSVNEVSYEVGCNETPKPLEMCLKKKQVYHHWFIKINSARNNPCYKRRQ